jgi:hypothetical protein
LGLCWTFQTQIVANSNSIPSSSSLWPSPFYFLSLWIWLLWIVNMLSVCKWNHTICIWFILLSTMFSIIHSF